MNSMGWQRGEPMPIHPERPSLLRTIVEAHLSGGLSFDEVAELALARPDDLRSMLGMDALHDRRATSPRGVRPREGA